MSALLAAGAALHPRVVVLDTASTGHGSAERVEVSLATPATLAALDASRLAPGATTDTAMNFVAPSGTPAVSLTTSASSSSLLDQDPVNGLRLAVQRCSNPWRAAPGEHQARYHCPGRRVLVLTERPVLVRNVALSNLDIAQGEQHLLLSLSLPESAGNEFQGLSTRIRYTFAALPPSVQNAGDAS